MIAIAIWTFVGFADGCWLGGFLVLGRVRGAQAQVVEGEMVPLPRRGEKAKVA